MESGWSTALEPDAGAQRAALPLLGSPQSLATGRVSAAGAHLKEGEHFWRWWLGERVVHASARLLTGGSGAGLRITQPLVYLLFGPSSYPEGS